EPHHETDGISSSKPESDRCWWKTYTEKIAQTWKSQAKSDTPYDGSGKVYDGDDLTCISKGQG
ncbi:hypothetical protein CIB48_g11541, partial [Xylaria polymorpha]